MGNTLKQMYLSEHSQPQRVDRDAKAPLPVEFWRDLIRTLRKMKLRME